MSTLPYYAFYPGDYFAKTRDLTIEQHGAYMLLLHITWLQPDCSLPNDKVFIRYNLPHMHGHTFKRVVVPILARFFVLGADDRWRNKRLTIQRQTSDKLSANQKQKIDKRWSAYRKNKDLADTAVIPSKTKSKLSTSSLDSESRAEEAGGRDENELHRIVRLKGWSRSTGNKEG